MPQRHDMEMTLELECWPDELSPAQLAAYEKAEKEHLDIQNKLKEVVSSSRGENLYLGDIFQAYQVTGLTPVGLDKIAKPIATVRRENKARQAAEEKRLKNDREAAKKREYKNTIETIDDDDDDDYIPSSKRSNSQSYKPQKNKKELEKKIAPKSGQKIVGSTTITPTEKVSAIVRPSETTSIGGLSIGDPARKKDIVDLTKDDSGRVVADSREITFNKLQGKTFPSLVVVARPSLKVKETVNDRYTLDAKVKSVLMHTATKYTEWLIQQGLVRSEQMCLVHHNNNLKLGMYSDVTKFPYSGGYVWISECCPSRFVSVFNGSLFEGASHPPSVLLKLIYHWACQTNVQNVVQWVKVDNLYVKGLYTWLRSVCTVAIHQHMHLLGGVGKKIEVGVISLGTTSQDGQQRQVKVEVLGVLDPEAKIVRLRAVEPLTDGERNYKKRFAKILEPLGGWVSKDSQILTDLTVDKGTLHAMGYKSVLQATNASNGTGKNSNANIMDYLRRIVPRMFQNTLSLLSRQIIQQFLDELVWREWYGTSPGLAFDNIVSHISEQTRLDTKETLVSRLNKVAANPFKNWAHLGAKTPSKTTVIKDESASTSGKRVNRNKRKEPSPSPPSNKKNSQKLQVQHIKDEPSKKQPDKKQQQVRKEDAKYVEPTVNLESYYYGIYHQCVLKDCGLTVEQFKAQCPECYQEFTKNVDLLSHILTHVYTSLDKKIQCQYCLENCLNPDALRKHQNLMHPLETKGVQSNTAFECLICEARFSTAHFLAGHMQKIHVAAELPYNCGCCDYASSSHRQTIDHFNIEHCSSGTLQCPLCLKIYTVFKNTSAITENILKFYSHLKMHQESEPSTKKCSKCYLKFTNNGDFKTHQMFAHVSQKFRQRHITLLCKTSTRIPKPKFRSSTNKETLTYVTKYNNYVLVMDNGTMCLECGSDFEELNHISGLIKCQKCKYHTSCSRALLEHTDWCNGGLNLENASTSQLDCEMHCICGFSSSEGNALARHLVTCERKSAYSSVEIVQENTVKRNMLDMLGLVRKDDEDDDDGTGTDAGGSTVGNDTSIGDAEPTTAASENVSNDNIATSDIEHHIQQNNDVIMDSANEQQFNTQLSLDDLAPPSVAPPITEPDRTPQLRDEYQSLATPRVIAPPYTTDGAQDDANELVESQVSTQQNEYDTI